MYVYIYIYIYTVYFQPVNYLERVISSAFTMKLIHLTTSSVGEK